MVPVVIVLVAALLTYRTSEASLVCRNGHIAGHPLCCADGCELLAGLSLVRDVIPYKLPIVVDLARPVEIEDGWLVDGHHRVSQAVRSGVVSLPVQHTSGVLAHQRAFHASVSRRVRDGSRVTI